jgi:hypothetical protein
LRVIDSRFFTSCLYCALALSMQALANNHFGAIGRLLHHPGLYADSFWLGLAPKAIAAVLLWKVITLRAVAGVGAANHLDGSRACDPASAPGRPDGAGPGGASERESSRAGS